MMHQAFVQYLVHPATPVMRLGLFHQLGSGKTRSMTAILENFYDVDMPKILLMKNNEQIENFYSDLIKYPSKYREFVYRRMGRAPPSEKRVDERREYVSQAKAILAFKGDPRGRRRESWYPAAGLRAFRITTQEALNSPLLRTKRSLSDTVVVADEAHNLWAVPPSMTKPQRANIELLVRELTKAKRARVVLATATPIVRERPGQDREALMKILRGHPANGKRGENEGYVSWYMSRPPSQFASGDPPLEMVPKVTWVDLAGDNLESYLNNRCGKPKGRGESKRRLPCPRDPSKLKKTIQVYENTGLYFTQHSKYKPGGTLANKLERVAADIKKSGLKTMVQVQRSNGLLILKKILKHLRVSAVVLTGKAKTKAEMKRRNLEIAKFNASDNNEGQKIQVIVLDAQVFAESISLKDVRSVILLDLSAYKGQASWSLLRQRVARAVRMCSHEDLPPSKRNVTIKLYLARMAKIWKFDTYDQVKLRALERDQARMVRAERDLYKIAVDRGLYPGERAPDGTPSKSPPASASSKRSRKRPNK